MDEDNGGDVASSDEEAKGASTIGDGQTSGNLS